MIKIMCFKTTLLLMGTIIGLGFAFADDLPGNTPDRVVTSAQVLVKSGLSDQLSIDITSTMLENHFNEDQIITVHNLMLASMAEGLPVQPLTGKVLEGVSKNIQPSRIVAAVKRVQARQLFSLSQGKQIVNDVSKARSLAEAYAASLAAGLTHDDAKTITVVLVQTTASLNSENTYDLSMVTLMTARDMSRLGVHSNTLADLISSALDEGFNASRMESMRQSFISQAHQTQPNSLARGYARAIDQGENFGNSSSGNPARNGKSGQGDNAAQSGPGAGNGSGGSGSGSGAGEGSGGAPGGSGSGTGGNSDGASGGSGSGSGSGTGDSGSGSGSGGSGNSSGSGSGSGGSGVGSGSGSGVGGSSGSGGSGGSGNGR